jgi:uncharacterized protein YigE (DUF2233 family)
MMTAARLPAQIAQIYLFNVKDAMDGKPWRDLPEYKADQRRASQQSR